MNVKEYIQSWADSYKKDLTENIMPFWMEHGWDRVNGGVYTCVNRDGSLMDSTKSVWFQGRFAFICAFAYNNVEPFILSVFFQEAFNQNLADFIDEKIFKKLNILDYKWENYGKYCPGATGLYLKHSDFHKIGQLLLNEGKYNISN